MGFTSSVINLQTEIVAVRSLFPTDSSLYWAYNMMRFLWSAVKYSKMFSLAVETPYSAG